MRNKENTVYVKIGVTAAAVIAFGLVLFFALYRSNGSSGAFDLLGRILRPFIIGGVLAYLLAPLSNRMSRLWGGKCQGLADVVTLLIALAVVLAILLLIVPQLVNSVTGIIQALPEEFEALKQKVMNLLQAAGVRLHLSGQSQSPDGTDPGTLPVRPDLLQCSGESHRLLSRKEQRVPDSHRQTCW